MPYDHMLWWIKTAQTLRGIGGATSHLLSGFLTSKALMPSKSKKTNPFP